MIHRLDEFLSHLAKRQPDLVSLLPEHERPDGDAPLRAWVEALPQNRLMEICTAWVLESMRRLKATTPLTNVLLRGCLHLSGEFDLQDAAAVAIGEVPAENDPRTQEIRVALARAVRLGVLIYLRAEERYCIPFPVRLSFEGVDFVEPLEKESIRLRMIRHFAEVAQSIQGKPDAGTPKHWRFSNILLAYEYAAELMEDLLGIEDTDDIESLEEVPEDIAEPLVQFGRLLGRALVSRQSPTGARLLISSAAAARQLGDKEVEAEAEDLLAQYYLRRREWDRAVAHYGRTMSLRSEANDHRGAVLARSAVAIALRDMGRGSEAVEHFVLACIYARSHQLAEEEIDTANCAAALLLATNDARNAIELIHEVIESVQRAPGRLPAFAELLANYGVAFRMVGHHEEARDWLLSALSISRSHLHRPAEARCLLELGTLFSQTEEFSEALKWLRRAREAYIELSDYAGIASTLLSLYKTLERMEADRDTEELLFKALKAAQKSQEHNLVADIWRECAYASLRRSDQTAALTQFHQEVQSRRRTTNTPALVEGHLQLAELYLSQEAMLAAGTEILRAQALTRSYLQVEYIPEHMNILFKRIHAQLSPEQFEYLVEEITEELESGILKAGG